MTMMMMIETGSIGDKTAGVAMIEARMIEA